MKRICIEEVDHHLQRYNTVGDWYELGNRNFVAVSKLGNDDMEFCVAIHEVVEQYLCNKRGISDGVVTEFDKANPDHPNPGDLPTAPYHQEHKLASIIELILLQELGVDLVEYDKRLDEVSRGNHAVKEG